MPDSKPFTEALAFSPSGIYGDHTKASDYYRKNAEILAAQKLPVPSDDEIEDVIAGFGRAAAQSTAAGFDGFAIHGAHGYLVDAFLWEGTNQRDDRWGGDLVARTTFATEVVKRVRDEIGEDKPISFRFSQWKQQEFLARLAENPDELEAILGPLSDAGVDLFEASVRYFKSPAFKDIG